MQTASIARAGERHRAPWKSCVMLPLPLSKATTTSRLFQEGRYTQRETDEQNVMAMQLTAPQNLYRFFLPTSHTLCLGGLLKMETQVTYT
jgi:hypothetical protein